jgi:hypothetical protein
MSRIIPYVENYPLCRELSPMSRIYPLCRELSPMSRIYPLCRELSPMSRIIPYVENCSSLSFFIRLHAYGTISHLYTVEALCNPFSFLLLLLFGRYVFNLHISLIVVLNIMDHALNRQKEELSSDFVAASCAKLY